MKIAGIPVTLLVSVHQSPSLMHGEERFHPDRQYLGTKVSYFRDDEAKKISKHLKKIGMNHTLEGNLAFGETRFIRLHMDLVEELTSLTEKMLRKRKK